MNPIVRKGLQNAFLELELARKSDTEIMKELGVSRETIISYRKLAPKVRESPTFETMKSVIRLEITQENALSELSLQMADYTKEYKVALGEGQIATPEKPVVMDIDAAHKWGALRLRCLENMLKVTGLDKGMPQAPNPERNTVTVKWISSRQKTQIAEASIVKVSDLNGNNEQSVKLVPI